MSELQTGWERSRRTHFDEIAAKYDKARWNYPDALFQDIFAYAGAGRKALEIGAGTGRATAPFLRAGYGVCAVELGGRLSAFLLDKFGARDDFSVINAAFEDVCLEDRSFDLVYAASAFHWVDAAVGCPKAFRLLKPGGAFALFRNNALPADGCELYEAIQDVYREYFHKPYVRPIKRDFNVLRGFGFESLESYGFSDITERLYGAAISYSADEYTALLDTYSDHRALPPDDRERLYAGVKEAIERCGAALTVDYVFQLYMGRK